MVYGPAPRTIIWSLQNGDCSEKGSRFCAGWWRLLSESLLELLRDEAAGAGIVSGRMPNFLSAELLSNKGREKLSVAPIVDAIAMGIALALIAIPVAGILGLVGLGSLSSSVLPCRGSPEVRPSK